MLEIKNSVAVITGGGGGIGLALAKHWITNGGKVVLADIARSILQEAAAALKEIGGDISTVLCDVTREDDCARLADTAIDQYGQINLVAPFAGITKDGLMLSRDRKTGKVNAKMSYAQFRSVMEINLDGVFLTVRECAERMVNHGCRGLICLISSTGSLGTAGQLNYSASKAAVSVMPRVLTAEFFRRGLADQIRCVAVAPGYVATPMVEKINPDVLDKVLAQIPIGRLISPAEVAAFVGDIYRNEALAGEVFFIHGGLRLGSKG
jgi:3-oxoacyl-[acyl-carrier protein] reductase